MSRDGCILPFVVLGVGLVIAFRTSLLPGIVIALAGVAWGVFAISRSAGREHLKAEDERRRLESIAPASGAAWRTLLEAGRIPAEVVTAIAPRVRPAVRITARKADSAATGASRLGGVPDLPQGLEWPARNGKPMTFLAQIALEEVTRVLPASALPSDGHLWFFYDSEEQPWGYDPGHAPGSRILYAPRQPLTAALPPAGLYETFASCGVELVCYDDIPDLAHDDPLRKRLDEAASERYLAVREYLAGGPRGVAHKLLGYADPVQGPMEEECALVSAGVNVGGGYPATPGAAALAAEARSWRLLLQVESDDETGMMWGDAGRLYFWMRLEDLQARRFDRARTILQCH
jgi:uncharacterized protein YwqG